MTFLEVMILLEKCIYIFISQNQFIEGFYMYALSKLCKYIRRIDKWVGIWCLIFQLYPGG
jgi:hypothetical protein